MGDAVCPIASDILQMRREIDELQEQVRTDHLTGLFNNRHLMYNLEQEMERTQRSHQPTTFILLDIDHFKSFNDTFGHVVGDKVLVHLSSIIQNTVRKLDIPCRYGGEEFGIILPSTPLLIGIQVAERLCEKVETTPLELDNKALPITISLGVDKHLRSHSETVKQFIARVDEQLYIAKNHGRNRVQHGNFTEKSKSHVSDSEKAALFSGQPNENN
ncbi:MAG: diguanylate cyclase (GGDEF)-like protein [Lentisphaeria bacterium]|jgi:diguanylate cyclase (GGDEF)-like protein